MKKIKYKQYYYGGDYSNKELNLPDSCTLYEVYPSVSYKIDDSDNWSKEYVILGRDNFDGAICMGNMYFDVLKKAYIEGENFVFETSCAPLLDGIYSVRYYENREARNKFNNFVLSLNASKITNVESKTLNKLAKSINRISSISKLKRITPDGIEITRVLVENEVTGKPEYLLEGNIIKYDNIHSYTYTNNPNIAKLFKTKCLEVYHNLI